MRQHRVDMQKLCQQHTCKYMILVFTVYKVCIVCRGLLCFEEMHFLMLSWHNDCKMTPFMPFLMLSKGDRITERKCVLKKYSKVLVAYNLWWLQSQGSVSLSMFGFIVFTYFCQWSLTPYSTFFDYGGSVVGRKPHKQPQVYNRASPSCMTGEEASTSRIWTYRDCISERLLCHCTALADKLIVAVLIVRDSLQGTLDQWNAARCKLCQHMASLQNMSYTLTVHG